MWTEKHIPKIQSRCPRIYFSAPAQVTKMSLADILYDRPVNTLVHWRSQTQHHPKGVSALSVRWTKNGRRIFESDGNRYAVDDDTYLIFNEGREFTAYVESQTPVSCYTLNYDPACISEIAASLMEGHDKLLDNPTPALERPLNFIETSYPYNPEMARLLKILENRAEECSQDYHWFDEQFRTILERLIHTHNTLRVRWEGLSEARFATRLELFQRLNLARDFIEASLSDDIHLDQIANVACMSPHHFLRCFKEAFGETPHRYLTRRRLERAKRLLEQTEMPITEVCFAIGFSSLGSFSWLFHKSVGLSPLAYRNQRGRQK